MKQGMQSPRSGTTERGEEGGGRGVQDAGHMYTHGWFMLIYGKNHHNIVK